MNQDRTDCIGAGTFYKLGNQEPAREGISPQTEIAERKTNPVSSNTETRFDPSTGERYCPPTLVADLQNPDWYIRMRAAWVIGKTRDVSGIVPLINALTDEHKEVRDRAQDALLALESTGEPLPVRVLLCETVDDVSRTDMLLAMTNARATRGTLYGYGSAKTYCETWLETETTGMNGDEAAVLAGLKRAAAAVLSELSRRSDANVLLRAGDSQNGAHPNHLLRSSEPGNRPGEIENLLLPSGKGTEETGGTKPTSGTP